MSYEIVKSVVIKDGKVYTRQASNNVYPKDFCSCENPGLTKLLENNGTIAIYKLLIELSLEGSVHFSVPGNKIVNQLNQISNSLYNDEFYKKIKNKVDELENKIWKCEDEKEKENIREELSSKRQILEKYVDQYVRSCINKKIKIPQSIKEELNNVKEMYEEDLENDEEDIFGGTEDSLANEMLEQHLYDVFSQENVEKIMALNNNMYTVLDINYRNKSYEEIREQIIDKLIEKTTYNIDNLSSFLEVIEDEKEKGEVDEQDIL